MYVRGLIPSGAVLGTDDFDAAMEQLEARGFDPRPYEIRRSLSAPAAEEVRYRITPLVGAGRLPVSILQDGNPLAMRTAWALTHPNAVVELVRVVLRVRDLETVRLQLSRLLADVRLTRGRIVVGGLGARFELVSQAALGLEREVSDRLPGDDPVGLLVLVFLSAGRV